MIRTALYERVSTDAQAEKYGLGAQDWALKKRATEKGYCLVTDGLKDAFIDDGYSGGDLNRPAILRLRQDVAQRKLDVVLCYDPDRLSRSLSDLLLLSDELEKAGVRLEFITQETDASPEGRMFFSMRGAVAEYERAKIRERTIRGRLEKARQGKVVSRAAASFGYKFDPANSKLVIDEKEAGVVRFIFQLYTQERLSILSLADKLNRLGVARPRAGQRWRSSTLGRMLANETYVGVLWQNRWNRQKKSENVVAQRRPLKSGQRPTDEQIATAVPQIISREIFIAARKRLQENLRLSERNTKREYLLTGLIKHSCGASMGGHASSGNLYYRCLKSQPFHAPINEKGEPLPCSCKWVNGHKIEAAVWDTVTNLLKQPELLMQELEHLAKPDSATREALEVELAQVRKRLLDIPGEERRLVEGYRKGLYADFMMREEMDRLHQDCADVEERSRELEEQLKRLDKALKYKKQISSLTTRLSRGLEHMAFSEKRELLRLLVDVIIYDDGNLRIKTIIPINAELLHPVDQRERGRVNS